MSSEQDEIEHEGTVNAVNRGQTHDDDEGLTGEGEPTVIERISRTTCAPHEAAMTKIRDSPTWGLSRLRGYSSLSVKSADDRSWVLKATLNQVNNEERKCATAFMDRPDGHLSRGNIATTHRPPISFPRHSTALLPVTTDTGSVLVSAIKITFFVHGGRPRLLALHCLNLFVLLQPVLFAAVRCNGPDNTSHYHPDINSTSKKPVMITGQFLARAVRISPCFILKGVANLIGN